MTGKNKTKQKLPFNWEGSFVRIVTSLKWNPQGKKRGKRQQITDRERNMQWLKEQKSSEKISLKMNAGIYTLFHLFKSAFLA